MKSPFLPNHKAIAAFQLPRNVTLRTLRNVADTIDLESLGIKIPHCQYPERFEAGFRYGLKGLPRKDLKTQFRPSYAHGFCLAKVFYRVIAERKSGLQMGKAIRFKFTASE